MDFAKFFTRADWLSTVSLSGGTCRRRGTSYSIEGSDGGRENRGCGLGMDVQVFPSSPIRRCDLLHRAGWVYCLPMRTLVEQTAARVKEWLARLERTDDVDVVILMGGEPREQWYLHPERAQIIIGTQDMLLSRALNRGYGSTPFMWPVEYGLLNNDCLWVMDEVQLMAHGLPTSTQLAGLRNKQRTFGPTHSLWMSATVKPGWLDTIDHGGPPASTGPGIGVRRSGNRHTCGAAQCPQDRL